MIKYEVKGLKFHKKTDSRSTFSEFTVAPSGKKAFSNVKFRLKEYNLRDVSIVEIQELPSKPAQINLFA